MKQQSYVKIVCVADVCVRSDSQIYVLLSGAKETTTVLIAGSVTCVVSQLYRLLNCTSH